MSSNPIDPVSDRSAEWNEAWKSVRRLADARRTVAESAGAHNASVAGLNGATRASRLAIDPRADDIPSISMQAQLDFAEIISASTALRTAQPDLEAWTNAKSDLVQTHGQSIGDSPGAGALHVRLDAGNAGDVVHRPDLPSPRWASCSSNAA
jgi:hypothetical protein